MRRLLTLVVGAAVLLAANYGIFDKERLLRDGEMMLIELAPVDPRSLMQGDYMALNFKIAVDAFGWNPDMRNADGQLVLTPDARGVAHFTRLHDGSPLQPGERLLRYRIRQYRPRVVTDAWFFQEGTAETYEAARYGELRVAPDGEALLVAMRDEQLSRLEPPR